MKNLPFISLVIVAVIILISCSDVKRTPGRDYMPDMRYSRAYETYAPHDNLKALGISYNASPVAGTVKRGEVFPYPIPRDKEGDSTNYVASRQVMNPLPALDTVQYQESERLYLINCGICHGPNLDGNGPLYNGGNGPYPAAPKNLVGDPVVSVMPEGQLFYSVTYGKNLMGPYGSQLSTSQRWRIVHYVKSKQLAAKGGGATPAGATAAPQGGSGNAATGSGNRGATATPASTPGAANGTTLNK